MTTRQWDAAGSADGVGRGYNTGVMLLHNEPTIAQRVIQLAIDSLTEHLVNGTDLEPAKQQVLSTQGRLIVMGVGKSGHIARKLASTFASTGTTAAYIHPTEAMHGDLGMVTKADTILALSQSGESDELTALLPMLRSRAAGIIAMTGNASSSLANSADIVIDTAVSREACPHNLAPTTSTLVALALGDALAISVMEARQFSRQDYAQLHPAGSLGRRLMLTVNDIMRSGDDVAVVNCTTTVGEVIEVITRARAGLACVVDATGVLVGVLSDGDIRRIFLKLGPSAWTSPVDGAMCKTPATIVGNPLAYDTLIVFELGPSPIGDIPVVDGAGHPLGVLTLKDLIRSGIVPHG